MGEYKSDWFPGRVTKPYREHYDEVRWDKSGKGIATKGKARHGTTQKLLEIDETVKAVRTPMSKRTYKTFQHID